MDNQYINKVAEAKTRYHKTRAGMPYEEKFKLIIEFQKLNFEMMKSNKSRKTAYNAIRVWQPE